MRISDWSSDVCSSDLLSAHLGSAFSLEPVLWQSAWLRAHNRDDVISNLYFVGAGTPPGAGLPGVVGTAKATAHLMLDIYFGSHRAKENGRAARRERVSQYV